MNTKQAQQEKNKKKSKAQHLTDIHIPQYYRLPNIRCTAWIILFWWTHNIEHTYKYRVKRTRWLTNNYIEQNTHEWEKKSICWRRTNSMQTTTITTTTKRIKRRLSFIHIPKFSMWKAAEARVVYPLSLVWTLFCLHFLVSFSWVTF